MELVDAVALVGAENVEALVCLNEAATAMRANLLELARNLAERAATIWRALGRPYATMMARAVAIACGAAADENEVEVLAERAMTCNGPGLGIQALGLLGRVFPEKRPLWQHAIPKLVQDVPRAHWHERMDVLSVNEAWEGATGNEPKNWP
jgi:eukaryotic-like serine/threonine-protein kinase